VNSGLYEQARKDRKKEREEGNRIQDHIRPSSLDAKQKRKEISDELLHWLGFHASISHSYRPMDKISRLFLLYDLPLRDPPPSPNYYLFWEYYAFRELALSSPFFLPLFNFTSFNSTNTHTKEPQLLCSSQRDANLPYCNYSSYRFLFMDVGQVDYSALPTVFPRLTLNSTCPTPSSVDPSSVPSSPSSTSSSSPLFGMDVQCPICFSRWSEGTLFSLATACGHSVCQGCAEKVTQCPTCRKAIGTELGKSNHYIPNFILNDGFEFEAKPSRPLLLVPSFLLTI
jgi:hypothetical protein